MSMDALSFSLISQGLRAIPVEMNTNLIRTAYSTVIREGRDASTGLLDAAGNVIAQAESIAVQLGALQESFRGCARELDLSSIQPQEIIMTNDPYHGASHVPDVSMFMPIFDNGVPVAWAGAVGHLTDIGGGAPGSANANATDIFGEGLLLPPMKVSLAGDFSETLVWQILRANIRAPQKSIGDLNAMLAATRTGVLRFRELVGKYGRSNVVDCIRELLNYSERRMRDAVARFPEGRFVGEEVLEPGSFAPEPIRIRAAVQRIGDDIEIDFTGTSPQVKGIINCSLSSTKAAAFSAMQSVMLGGANVPFNEGTQRPIRLVIPEGSILNPRFPAPVRARLNAALRAYGAIMRAMSQALPEQVIASGNDTVVVPQLCYFSPSGWQVFLDPLSGGYGASARNDGAQQCRAPLDNTANTPVEATESEYEFVRILRYELIPDSAGAGRFRGAQGALKVYEILCDDVVLTAFSDRHQFAPRGLFGGGDGTTNAWTLVRDGKEIELPNVVVHQLKRGDVLRVRAGGAGGYGDPRRRDHAAVAKDVREGRVSPQSARGTYGATDLPAAEIH